MSRSETLSIDSKKPRYSPTLGFVCPLFVELKAIKAIFDQDLGQQDIQDTTYYYGLISTQQAVAVQLLHGQTGAHEAAHCADYLLRHHPSLEQHTSHCFLVGIAGGIWSRKHDIRLGDVAIATSIWNWGVGKKTPNGFEHCWDRKEAPHSLRGWLGEFLDTRELGARIADRIKKMQQNLHEIEDRWEHQGEKRDVLFRAEAVHDGSQNCDTCNRSQLEERRKRSNSLPQVHVGTIATGPFVLKDATDRAKLQAQEILAVEMEADGVQHRVKFIVVRGISDYADSHKNDEWQPYAAATAAACTRLLIDSILGGPVSVSKSPRQDERHYPQSPVSDKELDSFDGKPKDLSDSEGSTNYDSPVRCREASREESPERSWTAILHCDAKIARVRVSEGPEDKTPKECKHSGCKIILEVSTDPKLTHRQQRLIMDVEDPESVGQHVFWIPFTNVQISRNRIHINIWFSNCKQMVSYRENHRKTYQAIYKPSQPNVHIELTCQAEKDAANLEALLLQEGDSIIPFTEQDQWQSANCLVRSGSINIDGTETLRAIMVWQQGKSSATGQQVTSFDMSLFSSRLDFDLQHDDAVAELRLSLMTKLKYRPEKLGTCTYWPPPVIQNNTDGHPKLIEFHEAIPPDDSSVVSSARSQIVQLLNSTVGHGLQSKAICWYKVDFEMAGPRRLSLSGGSKAIPGQMSIWYQDDFLLFLLRSEDKDNKSDMPVWTSWTLTAPSRCSGTAQGAKMKVSGSSIRFEQVDWAVGDHLGLISGRHPVPRWSDETRSPWKANATDAKIRFGSDAHLEEVRAIAGDFALASND